VGATGAVVIAVEIVAGAAATTGEAATDAVAVQIADLGSKNSNPCGGLELSQGFFVAAKLLL
jgi:hypothetical protein